MTGWVKNKLQGINCCQGDLSKRWKFRGDHISVVSAAVPVRWRAGPQKKKRQSCQQLLFPLRCVDKCMRLCMCREGIRNLYNAVRTCKKNLIGTRLLGLEAERALLMLSEVLFTSTLYAEGRYFPRRNPWSFFFCMNRACRQRSGEIILQKCPVTHVKEVGSLPPPSLLLVWTNMSRFWTCMF